MKKLTEKIKSKLDRIASYFFWQHKPSPEDYSICWVCSRGSKEGVFHVFTAIASKGAAGGFRDQDTWEDFDGEIFAWKRIYEPSAVAPKSPKKKTEPATALVSDEWERGIIEKNVWTREGSRVTSVYEPARRSKVDGRTEAVIIAGSGWKEIRGGLFIPHAQ